MTDQNKSLFNQALADGFNSKIQQDIDECNEVYITSRKHRKAVQNILGNKPISNHSKRISKKKIITILVAAVLLLTGFTTYAIARQVIWAPSNSSIVEYSYTNKIIITFSGNSYVVDKEDFKYITSLLFQQYDLKYEYEKPFLKEDFSECISVYGQIKGTKSGKISEYTCYISKDGVVYGYSYIWGIYMYSEPNINIYNSLIEYINNQQEK